ncbi:hypothetical protein SARC_00114 [Sphaeroforma arctica JP610]|uniref:Uncharacterized protein n=1 Tax=Sphaeroforma arctica JP610 TaxID=667725 RepID=A0A0L0GFQ5_9EUKA|nr:hypothetical protein SARC_00114 [Sphaeroforma arctica JP610]KNC87857.1 hypothetical protein SARC_00114 [Sphaeroforma arctica JP610]|eukprot:XP_014161759.1 hypothetical protein SARC_00114 [Sphaeroforma arctica JP610]
MANLTKFSVFGSCGRLLLSTNRMSTELLQNLLKTRPTYIDCREFMDDCPPEMTATSVVPTEPDKWEFVVASNTAELPPNRTFPQFGGPVIVARKLAYDPLQVQFRKRVKALHERRIRPVSRKFRIPPTVGRRLSTVYETFHELHEGSLKQGVPEIRISCYDGPLVIPVEAIPLPVEVADSKVESPVEVPDLGENVDTRDCWYGVTHAKLQYASM